VSAVFKLSAEDRELLSHYCSLRGTDAETFQAANRDRLAQAYTRANELQADPSEWLRRPRVTAITVLRVSPRGMTPAAPLSKQHRALLDTYAGLSGNDAIAFFEKHREALITASLAAAQAEDDGANTASPAQFPRPATPPPSTSTATASAPPAGTIQMRLSLVTESSGPAVALDLDYGVGAPLRALTVPISAIKPGWTQGLVLNVHQQQPRLARPGEPGMTPLPPKAPAASTSLPSRLRRIISRKTKP
jgi:hypothetical protein